MDFSDVDLSEIALLEQGMANVKAEALKVQQNLDRIQDVLERRASGELEEPTLNLEALDDLGENDPDIQKSINNYKEFVVDNIVVPFRENKAVFDKLSLKTQLLVEDDTANLFDHTYGPPISVKGQFIMAEDGLYYDSINGGVPTVSGIVAASSTWNLSQAPNLGGKGDAYTKDNLNDLVDTVFSYSYDPSSSESKVYYDSDDILESFDKNKAQHIDLIFKHIEQLEASGHAANSALVVNYYGNIGALADLYDNKIKRRKKLLQLVSIFGTHKYSFTEVDGGVKDLGIGAGILIENTGNIKDQVWSIIERIPLNDFTFLKGSGLSINLKLQEDLLIFSEDLEDVIAPVHVKFIKSEAQSLSNIHQFSVPPTPRDSFPHIQGDTHVSGTGGVVQALSTSITLDGMVLGYNFLTPSVVDPSSTVFNIDNFNTDTGDRYNGQLVGTSVDAVYTSGLSIPKLTGTGVGGAYVRLPSNYTPEQDGLGADNNLQTSALDNLFYPPNAEYNEETFMGGGVSFDFWVHIPSLVFTDQHRYRLVASCENSGGHPTSGQQLEVQANRTKPNGDIDNRKVHGMSIGFRDRGGSTNSSGIEFGVFPTVSQNQGNGSTGHSVCIAERLQYDGGSVIKDSAEDLGIITKEETLVNNVSVSGVGKDFTHVAVVFNFSENKVSTVFDGEVLNVSSISTAFDTVNTKPLMIPSLTRAINTANVGVSSWTNESGTGPVLGNTAGAAFTPWILGGGFTDGILKSGTLSTYNPGFLGYNTNTLYGTPPNSQHIATADVAEVPSSGLDGFLGSFKIYSRALSISEVRNNFNSQKGFFKNIKI